MPLSAAIVAAIRVPIYLQRTFITCRTGGADMHPVSVAVEVVFDVVLVDSDAVFFGEPVCFCPGCYFYV